MTHHVTEVQLDFYLDDGLDPDERQAVQAHLATCPTCRQSLEAQRPLFQALEQLAVPLPEDLAREVMARLDEYKTAAGYERSRSIGLLLALQGTIGLALLIVLIRRFGDWVPSPPAGWFSQIVGDLATALEKGNEALEQVLADLVAKLGTAAARLPDLLPFELTATQGTALLVVTVALWLIGNRLLLQHTALNGNNLRQKT
jgi:anti-sigma factor RsiW